MHYTCINYIATQLTDKEVLRLTEQRQLQIQGYSHHPIEEHTRGYSRNSFNRCHVQPYNGDISSQ